MQYDTFPEKLRNTCFVTKSICIPMTSTSMISLFISVFGIVCLTVAVKLVSLQPCGRKYLLLKIANACIFSAVNRKKKPILVNRQPDCKIWTQQQTANPINYLLGSYISLFSLFSLEGFTDYLPEVILYLLKNTSQEACI